VSAGLQPCRPESSRSVVFWLRAGCDDPYGSQVVLTGSSGRLSPSIRGLVGSLDSRLRPPMQPACNTGVVADARRDDNRGAPVPEPDSDLRRPGWQSTAADARARVACLLHRRIWPCSTADRQLLRTRRGPETTRLRRSRSRSRSAVSTTPGVQCSPLAQNKARNYRIPTVAGFWWAILGLNVRHEVALYE
jgi:hypothetical protein